MKLTLLFLIAIGVAFVAAKPIDTEEPQPNDVSIVNDSQDADKRKEVPKKQAKKLEGNFVHILIAVLFICRKIKGMNHILGWKYCVILSCKAII